MCLAIAKYAAYLLALPFFGLVYSIVDKFLALLENHSVVGIIILLIVIVIIAAIVYLWFRFPSLKLERELARQKLMVQLPTEIPPGDISSLSKFLSNSTYGAVLLRENATDLPFLSEREKSVVLACKNIGMMNHNNIQARCSGNKIEIKGTILISKTITLDNEKLTGVLYSFVDHKEEAQTVVREIWYQKVMDCVFGAPETNLRELREKVNSDSFRNMIKTICIKQAHEAITDRRFPIQLAPARRIL